LTDKRERKSLGRGLSALIPDAQPVNDSTDRVLEINVELIDPNPMQPRQKFDPEALEELKKSIEEVGVLTPVIVQKIGERYQMIAGERRLHASKLAKKPTIPCIIRDANSEDLLKIALIENIQREDLNDIELARAYEKLRDDFFLTQSEIAQKVGKSRSVIANTLRLLELSQNLQEAVRKGDITSGHARALLALDEGKREKVLEIIRKKSLSVRDVEAMAKSGNGHAVTTTEESIAPGRTKEELSLDPDILNLLKKIEEKFRTKVEVQPSKKQGGGGKLIIHYYGDDDFDHIMGTLAE
jgi:ParB family chromosome partitioning protein